MKHFSNLIGQVILMQFYKVSQRLRVRVLGHTTGDLFRTRVWAKSGYFRGLYKVCLARNMLVSLGHKKVSPNLGHSITDDNVSRFSTSPHFIFALG